METDESCFVTPISNIGKLASHSQKTTISENLQRENRMLKFEIAALNYQMEDADKVIMLLVQCVQIKNYDYRYPFKLFNWLERA